MIKKVLIANRGEIAVRVIRACQELSIETVAIYSEVDRAAPHVLLADEAVFIGAPEPAESYLNTDKIIKIAHDRAVDAIHPGYGFLAENAEFARRCEQEKITFIGPRSAAMALLGDKIKSRQTMIGAGIPVIPGMQGKVASYGQLAQEAEKIGYPVLLKASAGGGGKGMRIVRDANQLKDAMEAGMREAKSAFGDDSVYLEKYIENPRHIEFQILADNFGNMVHLYERECSIQRRHQKIIEESPSVALNDNLRNKMGETAIKVVKTSGYSNAGTVEFLLDKDRNFYFLEVNARLQVEHPVTELVTGVDLVKQQIHVANGEKLTLKQDDIQQRGHAIECRIYAEDPENNFLPSLGKIDFVKEPQGPGIRNDSGIYSGIEVSMYYDPILAKLIVRGENRDEARLRMINALNSYAVLGIKTQIPFMRDVLSHPEFVNGNTFTNFIEQHFPVWKQQNQDERVALIAAAIFSFENFGKTKLTARKKEITPWQTTGSWEILQSKSG